jgi:hypothetical protein
MMHHHMYRGHSFSPRNNLPRHPPKALKLRNLNGTLTVHHSRRPTVRTKRYPRCASGMPHHTTQPRRNPVPAADIIPLRSSPEIEQPISALGNEDKYARHPPLGWEGEWLAIFLARNAGEMTVPLSLSPEECWMML